tara:strand:- start:42129 stop:42668 length:540 start_codon:yes stop_codon:yes gene_type:complete
MAKQIGQMGGTGGEMNQNNESSAVGGDGVELSEEVIWKARAQEAEEKLAQVEARVIELERALEESHESVRSVERRSAIDMELIAAKAIDLETARMLTEAAIGEMDAPDVGIAVRELCDRKPFLFAGRRGHGHGTHGVSMGPGQAQGASGDDEMDELARHARSSGDRSELLRYLRVRRGQ